MSRTYGNEKNSSKSTPSVQPTASFLQTRDFAPLQTDLDEDAPVRPSGYTENFLEKIINQRGTESSDTPIQAKPMNRLTKPLQSKRMAIQAKLSIGEPNDKYEQEADATASKVVQQINSPTQDQSVQREESMEEEDEELQMKPISTIQREESMEEEDEELQMKSISTIQREESMEEEDEELQMKSLVQRRENLGGGEASIDLESSIQSARGSGQSLDPNLQAKMSEAMGADFSGVKVHTDSQSDQLNKSIQAKAFTTGQDVFFRQGAYSPSSRGGQELIAHELTHVVQQNGGAVQRSPQSMIQRNFLPNDLDPSEITTVTTIANAGQNNKGVFRLSNQNGDTVVVKFTDEDTARSEYADMVIGTSGVQNTESKGIDSNSNEGTMLANNMEAVSISPILNAIQHGRTARYISVMKNLTTDNFNDAFSDPNFPANNVVTSNVFANNLGKMFATDTLLGNSDRIVSSVTSSGNAFVAINGGNFKVAANSDISVLDNDTQLLSRELLQKYSGGSNGATYLKVDDFADKLMSGYTIKNDAPGGILRNMGVQDLFNPNIGTMLAQEIQRTLDPNDLNGFNPGTFAIQFNLGVTATIQSLLANAGNFMTNAVNSGNPHIDPSALATKLSYIHNRQGGGSHNDGQNQGRLFASLMIFDESLIPVPQLINQGKSDKFKRGMTKRTTESKRLETLKKEARNNNLALENLEERIIETRGINNAGPRKAKAEFELGYRKTVAMMSERTQSLIQADNEINGFANRNEVIPYLWLFDPANTGIVNPNCPMRVAMLAKYTQVAQGYLGQMKINTTAYNDITQTLQNLSQAVDTLEQNVLNANLTLP